MSLNSVTLIQFIILTTQKVQTLSRPLSIHIRLGSPNIHIESYRKGN